MKPLLIFLLCLLPATGLLAYLDRFDRGSAQLPDEAPADEQPPLLLGSDLSDAYGQSPFAGSVRRLDGLELRVVEEGYFKLYLRIDRLGRHDGRPRLEGVSAVVFDPPKDGKPNLRLTLRAPYVWGDPRELLHAPADAPRTITLDGGVEALDAAGRPMAEVPRLTIDIQSKRIAADAPVVLKLPERAAEVRAAGLDADLDLRRARLKGPLLASLDGLTLRAAEGATVEEAADGGEVRIVIEGGAELEQAAGRATCARLEATLLREEGRAAFRRATLSGGVRLEFAPGPASGIEAIEMPSLDIEGADRITCKGPVRATWRGQFAALASALGAGTPRFLPLGERTVTIDADSAALRLGRAEDGRLLLDEARFGVFRAADTAGAGWLAGRSLVYTREGTVLAVDGAVEATTPEGSFAADRLRVESPAKDAYDLVIEGEKRLVYLAEGRLGPLGDGSRGELRLTSKGPLRVRVRGDAVECEGQGEVIATTDGGARLRSDEVRLTLEGRKLASFVATGGVVASEPSRGAEIKADALRYDGDVATIEGSPASIAMKDGRSVRAPGITYRGDRTFAATGGVEVMAALAAGESWRLSSRDLQGSIAADGTPGAIGARGDVRAEGPGGEVATGDALEYDGAKGIATLLGKPAHLRRGEEMDVVATDGLTMKIEEGRVVEGSSLGPVAIDYRPPPPAKGAASDGFRRWRVELKGPARFDGDRVVVAKGAKLKGSDGERDTLFAEAARVEIALDLSGKKVTVKEIAGSGGVRVEGRGKQPAVVTAQRLSYGAGTGEVRVHGDARVVAEGWPREVRFRELVFVLTKDGVDLRRASDVEVR